MNKLMDVFHDTMEVVKSGELKTDSVTMRHRFSNIVTVNGELGKIFVENTDSVSALSELSGSTCVLNMASYKRAGGGVARGARAQEECLFRCSNLFETVIQEFYPLDDHECLYTRDAVFFKDFHYNRMTPVMADVVTISAINLRRRDWKDEKKEKYERETKKKMRLMMSLAFKRGVDNLVLGAWGCGVFKNDPAEMAQMFRDVLIEEKYAAGFKTIIFAIINDHNSVGSNYEVFQKVLG